jgi:hypothetical protein
MANLSFTKESQDNMVNGFIGDFAGFQTFIEGGNVSGVAVTCIQFVSSCLRPRVLIQRYTGLLEGELCNLDSICC